MKILMEKETGYGGSWVLVQYKEDFFAHGLKCDMTSFLGFPVNNVGTKKNVIGHCKSIAELCRENIAKYEKEKAKKNSNKQGWELLIADEKRELEMLTDFYNLLENLA